MELRVVDKRRKTVRLSLGEIPEILQNPTLLINYAEVESRIENMSPLGVGLIVSKRVTIAKGDIFHLKYNSLEYDISCICVFSDEDEENRAIGAYFTDQKDQKIILNCLEVN